MRIRKQLYLSGIFLTILFVIFAQLMWLFDSIRIKPDTYWIDIVEWIIYLPIIVPLLWMLSAAIGVIHTRERRLFILRILVMIFSALMIFFLILDPKEFIWIGIFLAASWLLIHLELIIEERIIFRRISRIGIYSLVVSLSLVAILLWPTPYMITYPGLTLNMNQYAEVEDGEKNGEITGVLIFERPAFPIDWLYSQLFPHYNFKKRTKIDLPLNEQLRWARELKLDANQIGSAIAFEKLGIGEGMTTHGVKIIGILEEYTAFEKLKTGDVIIQINDHDVLNTEEFMNYMTKLKVGDDITLTVMRQNEVMEFSLKLQAALNDPKKAILGVQIINEIHLDLQKEVSFQNYLLHEGGPSHGAMLSLAIIDQLTPGGVTNGNKVAGTGTINIFGEIGPIGGIEQKTYLVSRAGADVFFVPAQQYEEARKGSDHLNIVPVSTLDDILNWLEDHPKIK